jgi:arylformamidase
MLYDITRTIGLDTLAYPGDAEAELRRVARCSAGDGYNLTALQLSCHSGTHLDAPWHFIDGGAKLDELPPARFMLRAYVVDAGQGYTMGPELVAGLALQPGEAVLFKTRNANLPRVCHHAQIVGLEEALAQRLVELQAGLVGIDYLSIELGQDGRYPVHEILLTSGALILEDADLRAVPPGVYKLYCLPLKLHQTEAAPCRALLETLG